MNLPLKYMWYPSVDVGSDYYPEEHLDEIPNTGSNKSKKTMLTQSERRAEKSKAAVEEFQSGTVSRNEEVKSNEAWVKAIRELFMKWGYKLEEIPEPFGSKTLPDITEPSPEFAMILKGLLDSIPGDLKPAVESILQADGIHNAPGASKG
jgi:hypothetical protein